MPSLSREIICPQTGKRDRADHDLAIIENRRGLTDKDGNKRTRFEVVADEVEFAESRRAAEDQPAGSLAAGYMENEGFAEIDGEDGELPF